MLSLEERTGHFFKNRNLLLEALTHPSARHLSASARDNQRLEYLGDAVLQLILSEHLYHHYPREAEGQLTKLRTRLVQMATLARVALRLDLGSYLLLSRGEEGSGGRQRESILADALEALIGAVYLDGGLGSARRVVESLWGEEIASVQETPVEMNPKGELQEILQDIGETPTYRIIASEGPDHARQFEAVVLWKDQELGKGEGRSKRDAQIAAAESALNSEALRRICQEHGVA